MRQMLGASLIILGLLCISASLLFTGFNGNAAIGGVIFVGPIPIVFGSSPQMVIVSILISIVFMIISLFLFRGWR